MKYKLLIIILFSNFIALTQAKKPTIMIVPSDRYCNNKGYIKKIDLQGEINTYSDYKKALLDNDLGLVVTKINGLMSERGFPLVDLKATMKNIETQNAEMNMMQSKQGASISESPLDIIKRNAKADIILELFFEIKQNGFDNYCQFSLEGIDSYTNKSVASASGTGLPNVSASADLLLEEAVLQHIDNFNFQLMNFFSDLQQNGREITIKLKVWDTAPFDLEEEFEYDGEDDELSYLIENMIIKNSVNNQAPTSDGTENYMTFQQVRIPLFDSKGRALDARRFARNISKILAKEPFMVQCKTYPRGLGEAWIIIGEK